MNAVKLTVGQGSSEGYVVGDCVGWACGKCGAVYTPRMYGGRADEKMFEGLESDATKCCGPRTCNEDGCTNIVERGYTKCGPCMKLARAAKEQAAFDHAEKVTLADYKGEFLYHDDAGDHGSGDGYVSVEDVEDRVRDMRTRDSSDPKWMWGTMRQEESFDLSDSLSSYLSDNSHEDAYESVDTDLIKAAQILVDAALKGVVSFHEDRSVAVLLPDYPADDDDEPVAIPEEAPVAPT